MHFSFSTLLSQLPSAAQFGVEQKEYFLAYALIIAMVVLGAVAVCIPRPREKHFVEPETSSFDKIESKRKKKR